MGKDEDEDDGGKGEDEEEDGGGKGGEEALYLCGEFGSVC